MATDKSFALGWIRLSWLGVVTISNSPLLTASKAQPLTKRKAAAFEKSLYLKKMGNSKAELPIPFHKL
jgi:hypothetical protein